MKSDNLKMENNSLLFENADCKVSYNFWSEGGWVTFAFENKTNEDIFINMNESFLIVNGYVHNYFEEKTYTYRSTTSQARGETGYLYIDVSGKANHWPNGTLDGSNNTSITDMNPNEWYNYVSRKEQEIVCIPAKSYKVFSKFCLSPLVSFLYSDNVNFPNSHISINTFEKADSPVTLKNCLTYKSKNSTTPKHIQNEFWLGEIENYPKHEVIENKKVTMYSRLKTITIRQYKIGGPAQFYNVYGR